MLSLFRGGDGWTPDSGLLLYGETLELPIRNGRLTHAVGTGHPTFGTLTPDLLAASGQTSDPEQVLWLQIAVAGEPPRTVLPRTQLNVVPSAASAAFASDSERLGGFPADAYARKAELDKAARALVRVAGTGYNSFIGGGIYNDASGPHTTIGAGYTNSASSFGASILGGFFHQAAGAYASIGGGNTNRTAADYATVAGGDHNQATAPSATVGGGANNAAQGAGNTIGGGLYNWATRLYSAIGGGSFNQAIGNYSTVPGGLSNSAAGSYSLAAGRRAKASAAGTFVWADSRDADYSASLADTVRFRARNGVTVDSDGSYSGLQVRNIGSGRAIAGRSAGGYAGHFFSETGDALYAHANVGDGGHFSSGSGAGLTSTSNSGNESGVIAAGNGTDGNGVVGIAHSGPNSRGVWGASSSGYAGYFSGKVHVTGTLSKAAGSFKIDHPLDPANRYLSHSFVESPDMMNIYNGNSVLDGDGRATVTLPAYFEALNRDFRYQLSPIGAPAPSLHIAQEIGGSRFVIAGGPADLKVSWQVTGIRKDAYAQQHPIVVEEEKPAEERGTYLHPREYGQPESKRVHALKEQATVSKTE
ncbi:MAG: hypothetical protein H0U67_04070 [Gemmatimonadetes bacterium]|nr:hypothetical protein [Gemmatimonadota bacterium]